MMSVTLRWMCLCAVAAAGCLGCAATPGGPPAAPAAAAPISTGPATIVVAAPPAAASPIPTLPEFLGISGLLKGACKAKSTLMDRLRNRLGKFYPGLEAKPPVLAITDPANANSSNPAVSTAADIKAQEDAAPQKIKALRYLATIGCGGCYPDVEKSFLAALEDCTEEVRFEAAMALRTSAGNPCQYCKSESCCSPAIRKKLKDLGYGVNEKTKCYNEPSARVRRMARLALGRCGLEPPTAAEESKLPEEGPTQSDLPGPKPPSPPPSPGAANSIWRPMNRFSPADEPLFASIFVW